MIVCLVIVRLAIDHLIDSYLLHQARLEEVVEKKQSVSWNELEMSTEVTTRLKQNLPRFLKLLK